MEFSTGSEWSSIPGGRPRALLALLIVNAGHVVTVERLVAELWPEDPPLSAPALIRGYVLQLRRTLGDSAKEIIITGTAGYELGVVDTPTDAERFEALAARGLAELEHGAPHEAESALAEALALWRGTPFLDAPPTPALGAEANRLRECRLHAAEARIEARMQLGKSAEVVGELRALLGEHPLREGLWAQLMRALHTTGNRADALEAYRRARQILTEELGLEPSGRLQALHQMILTDADPVPDPPASGTAAPPPGGHRNAPPAVLPHEVLRGNGAFAGRVADLARVERLLLDTNGPQVVVIDGVGGVGKSELAIHLAHQSAHRFPDGVCHVDLQGARGSAPPLEPTEALGRMLRSLGVPPPSVPGETAEAAARFRSLTANRRMLFVLDNACHAPQVQPLLPARSCAVLVTSRRALPVLGSVGYHLEAMSEEDSLDLLGRLVAPQRIAAEPDQALRIVRLCGGLPLALRIAGARLASRPHWPLRFLADKLASEQHRLDELKIDDLAVRSGFAISCQDLESLPEGREPVRVFRFLGIPRWSSITIPLTAALTDLPRHRAEQALESLLDARLLESPQPGHYRMHSLMRLFAREQAGVHLTKARRDDALLRALEYYVAAGLRVTALLDQLNVRWLTEEERVPPGGAARADRAITEPATPADAIAWLDDHRDSLVSAVRQAASIPGAHERMAIRLAATVCGPLRVRGHLQDSCALSESVLQVAGRVGDVLAEVRAHLNLACCRGSLDHDDGRSFMHLLGALDLCRTIGDSRWEGRALYELAAQLARHGDARAAGVYFNRGLGLLQAAGESHDVVLILHQLGLLEEGRGDTRAAARHFRRGVALAGGLGYRHGEYYNLAGLARLTAAVGDHGEAVTHFLRALDLAREVGEWHGEARLLGELAESLDRVNLRERARECRDHAVEILTDMGAVTADEVGAMRRSAPPTVPVRLTQPDSAIL
ncbi:AfsR/SARP family transcriptional regulator [Thermomonospora umbrina]|uniref:AfsR/SARP family transcriptional regulator n=1 Tax=Thermomonospora umbrina TaxID=111806 RepID=UPI00147695CA|nr:BTAD domain-containing putative transcriptional regulator [Thermomonospora umbrina]